MISAKPDIYKIILFMLFLGTFYSSAGQKGFDQSNYKEKYTLPGVVPVDGKLLYDKMEVSNAHWREYMYWTKRTFGVTSKEYQATIPNQAVWTNSDFCLTIYDTFYLYHDGFNSFPLVGLTQQQAIAYTKWRTDRVFEKILILMNLRPDMAQDSTNYFTVERYFTGVLGDLGVADKKVWYYPEFRLPTVAERERILHISDSLYASAKHRKTSKPTEGYMNFYCDFKPCVKGMGKAEYYADFVQEIFNGTPPVRSLPIINMRGNVGEWLDEEGVSAGGGWKDKRERILESDTFNIGEPNAWTGFRNICEWKKWGE